MVPDFLKTKGCLFGGSFTALDTSKIDVTFAFAPGANQGQFHGPLPNYATSNRPGFLNTFSIGGAAGTPLAGYDDVMIMVGNQNPGATGFPVVMQFGWRGFANEIATCYEMGYDLGPSSSEASALTAGATNSLGQAAGVRRYPADIAEFGPIEINGGRLFRFPVAGPWLVIGAATVGGAAAADQVVLVQVVPRTIGVSRGG